MATKIDANQGMTPAQLRGALKTTGQMIQVAGLATLAALGVIAFSLVPHVMPLIACGAASTAPIAFTLAGRDIKRLASNLERSTRQLLGDGTSPTPKQVDRDLLDGLFFKRIFARYLKLA